MIRLVAVLIHELVHIKQHSRQDDPWNNNLFIKGRPLEYRSYLIERREFISIIKDSSRGIKTEKTNMIHSSSPQEIPAKAHSFVLKYIGGFVDVSPLTLQSTESDIQLLQFYIDKMDYKLIDERYQIFNVPNSKVYRIYRRYMKNVYREMMIYKQFLLDIKKKLEGSDKSNPPV